MDIRQIDPAQLPPCEAIIAGWPCQPFSRAGHQLGFLDPGRGDLFFELYRLVQHLQPPMIFLENVPNLVTHNQGKTLRHILRMLREEGYRTSYRILDGATHSAQHRRRTYIVGLRQGRYSWKIPKIIPSPLLGDITHQQGEITSHTPQGVIPRKYTLGKGTWQALQKHARRHAGLGHGFGFSLGNLQKKTRTLSARYYKDGAEILLAGKPRPRKLTPRECARLMGFPDSFILHGSDTQCYRQLGNSVVVPLIADLARNLRRAWQNIKA
jgi:DNA (cytosine-5)-methyltransferase 1